MIKKLFIIFVSLLLSVPCFAEISHFTITDSDISDNSNAHATLDFYLYDNAGAPLANEQITIDSQSGLVITQPGLTDSDGHSVGYVASTIPGDYNITAMHGSNQVLPNQLRNPSVEQMTGATPTHWSTDSVPAGTGTFAVSTTVSHSGSRSVTINNPRTLIAWWFQNSNLVSSASYRFSAFAKTTNVVKTGTAGGASLYQYQYASNGDPVYYGGTTTYLTGTNDWTAISMDFTTVARQSYTSLEIELEGCTGLVYFDDIRLYRNPNMVVIADTAPPANVIDLVAATGVNNGDIDISFTAPGDDGALWQNTGSYVVKYSTAAITDANFADATSYTQVWVPAAPGAKQSQTIALTSLYGAELYIAIKTADNKGNTSDISNIVKATVKQNKTPITTLTLTTDLSAPIVSNKPLFQGAAPAGYVVSVYLDNAYKGFATATAAGDWSFQTLDTLEDGLHLFKCQAADGLGNLSDWVERQYTIDAIPDTNDLQSPYPNPLRTYGSNFMVIPFYLKDDGAITLKVFSIDGECIKEFFNNEDHASGRFNAVWDGKTSGGELVSTGTYIIFYKTSDGKYLKKVTVIK